MSDMSLQAITRAIREAAYPLIGAAHDYDPLLDLIGDAHFVLIGEASHGTHEFYRERATITKRLIMEKGFTVVAIEADWPDAYRVNRYVRDIDDDTSGNEALAGFKRFPTWMWRNTDVLEFIEWLRLYNRGLVPDRPKVGFYGLDLYSLYTSIEAVIAYLEQVDPEAAQRARTRYSCFEHFGEDTASYGYAASLGLTASCEDDVVNQLKELQQKMTNYARRDGRGAEDEFFYAQQNARLARDAEEYYRSMFRASDESWNVRDRHMADTLDALVAHFDRYGGSTKAVVWEHNSHLGDARATSTSAEGELNVGQLVRERYNQDARLIGFTTYSGTVTAASDWDQPAERKRVRPALAGSYEFLFHQTGIENFLLDLRADEKVIAGLHKPRLERAIGVIYLPQTERRSHYFHARLPDQFDAIIHLDQTQALEPLEPTAQWQSGEVEETFPSGL